MKSTELHKEHLMPSETADYTSGISDTTVVPEVVSKVTEKAILTVNYNGRPISNGEELTPSETQEELEIDIKGSETYTLVMVDPDAPSPDAPKYRFFLHWLVTNIPSVDVKRGNVIEDYMGPSPPKGKHRYVFILYPQHGRVNAKAPKTRQSFTLHQFEKEHNLGDPADVKFFYSSPE
ncbi:g2198 [Coccomyxa viridis]|uniref:G2198 protein n=1 Tax=Coccomyxa viridis TaxID=1274662 RepID=A0ABP1FQ86_9CHLO